MKVRIVKPGEVELMCEALRRWESLGFDTETTDLDPRSGELRLLQISPTPNSALVLDLRQHPELKDRASSEYKALKAMLEDPAVVKIMHNGKFDCKWVKHHLGIEIAGVYDTFICSKIETRGDKTLRNGLKDVLERHLGIEVDKTEQRSDWGANELSEAQINYAAKDVCVLHELRDRLEARITLYGMDGCALLENSIVPAMAAIELNGFYLHAPAWRQLVVTAKSQERRLNDELQDLLYAGSRQLGLFGRVEVDLGSWQQVGDALLRLGVPLDGRSTKEDKIEHLTGKFPVVDKLLEWRGFNKQISSYGDNILDLIHPVSGRIHADFNQIEAPSGRMGCRNPNLQNIPAEKDYRMCFRAAEGKRLVVADYSQIELRVLADYSEDTGMIKAFTSGQDYHTATAATVFGVAIEKVTPDQRSFAKRVNFGVAYGIGVGKLSRMTGMDWDTTEKFLKKYFAALPDMDKWLRRSSYKTLKSRQAKTMSGRIARWEHLNPEDEGQAGSLQRLGKNTPIQGSAADIFKRGLHLLHNEFLTTSAKIVNLVHDEYVIECDEAEAQAIAERTKTLAEQAGAEYLTQVPVKVDVKILSEWQK